VHAGDFWWHIRDNDICERPLVFVILFILGFEFFDFLIGVEFGSDDGPRD
jgi:hypothetical protein